MGNIEHSELEELRRFKAWALRDEPEYVKANATLKHRVRELEAELATTQGAVEAIRIARDELHTAKRFPRVKDACIENALRALIDNPAGGR